nr:zinc finger protein 83-like [Danaus plexippus plexippus]
MKRRGDYVCNSCNHLFTRKNNLQTHILNGNCQSNVCIICERTFSNSALLQAHMSRGHNKLGKPQPECDLCGRIFTRKHNLVSHMIVVHLQAGKQNITCNLCDRKFNIERNLKRHMKHKHTVVDYSTCDICKKNFKDKGLLASHIETVHLTNFSVATENYKENKSDKLLKSWSEIHKDKSVFKCNICSKIYLSSQSLKRHTRTLHGDKNYCKYCSKFIKDDIEKHINNCHKNNEDKYIFKCEVCNAIFEYEHSLRGHIREEHSFQQFYDHCKKSLLNITPWKLPKRENNWHTCEFCCNTFASVYDLKDHMKSHHDIEYNLSTCNVCFNKFYSKETMFAHKKNCFPPKNANACRHCDKLFTDISSLNFHVRIFHPQAQIADSKLLSNREDLGSFKCDHCDRIYYSDRSLKHHVKLKHSSDEAAECQYCGKICNNKYYLASHIKIVHNNDYWAKCDFCDKQFKSKRNIRRHIEYTHLGMQRYKCIECGTLFKEKRSLRKHVRIKHPDSTAFPQCHICKKRFESAKSCKIHLKLLHSFNMNTHPCDLCSLSFDSLDALNIHLSTKHLAKDEIYKCEECNLVFKGQITFDCHNDNYHACESKEKNLPRCIICAKDFRTRKTLKRHIKRFHEEFNVEELATYGTKKRMFNVNCTECIKNFNNDFYFMVYSKMKHLSDSFIFKCELCSYSYNCLEYAIQRYKQSVDVKGKLYLSELCTTEMSENDSDSGKLAPESNIDSKDDVEYKHFNIKIEPSSP